VPKHALALIYAAPLLGILLIACGGSNRASEAPLAEPTSNRAASISFEFDPGVSMADRKLVLEASQAARSYFISELGRDLQSNVTIVVTTNDGAGYLGFSYGRKAWLFTGSPDWSAGEDRVSVGVKYYIVAHEMFHNFQSDLLSTDDALPSYSPSWLLEGTADYAAHKFIEQRGDGNLRRAIAEARALLHNVELPRLGATRVTNGPLYALALLAADRLLAGKQLRLVGDYFADTGRMDWEDAFLKHFGKNTEAFIEEFEATRAR
jgi:hypothetical protein